MARKYLTVPRLVSAGVLAGSLFAAGWSGAFAASNGCNASCDIHHDNADVIADVHDVRQDINALHDAREDHNASAFKAILSELRQDSADLRHDIHDLQGDR